MTSPALPSDLTVQKLTLEVSKLQEEIAQFRRPFYRSPATLFGIATTAVAVLGAMVQMAASARSNQLVEIQRARTQLAVDSLVVKKAQLSALVDSTLSQLAQAQSQRDEVGHQLSQLQDTLAHLTGALASLSHADAPLAQSATRALKAADSSLTSIRRVSARSAAAAEGTANSFIALRSSLQVAQTSAAPGEQDQLHLAIASSTGRLKAVLSTVADLSQQHIPFVWGGKSPAKGFDSSGFVAYVLSAHQFLATPESFWSGALRQRFAPGAPRTAADLQVGDLAFYPAGYCAFYIGGGRVVGMIAGSVQVLDVAFGAPPDAFGHVPY